MKKRQCAAAATKTMEGGRRNKRNCLQRTGEGFPFHPSYAHLERSKTRQIKKGKERRKEGREKGGGGERGRKSPLSLGCQLPFIFTFFKFDGEEKGKIKKKKGGFKKEGVENRVKLWQAQNLQIFT